ncbi:HD domain-containing protein, partial [Lactobacillus acidophilus]|uniref:HD domain-containing protein n=1 Tax=Lactobacillus acidophilus TaxID=1579 RepID=UPI003F5337A4
MIQIIKLSNDVLSLWGKKNNDDGQKLWLPLVTHLVDTRHVINFLFNNWLSNGQKKLLYETLSEEEVLRLVRFLGQFHDIAKAIPAFQKEKSFNRNEDLDNEILEKLLRNG